MVVGEDGENETFSPASGRSPHSSMSSPQVSVDSPRICFSPLRIKDSIEEEEALEQKQIQENVSFLHLKYISHKES